MVLKAMPSTLGCTIDPFGGWSFGCDRAKGMRVIGSVNGARIVGFPILKNVWNGSVGSLV